MRHGSASLLFRAPTLQSLADNKGREKSRISSNVQHNGRSTQNDRPIADGASVST